MRESLRVFGHKKSELLNLFRDPGTLEGTRLRLSAHWGNGRDCFNHPFLPLLGSRVGWDSGSSCPSTGVGCRHKQLPWTRRDRKWRDRRSCSQPCILRARLCTITVLQTHDPALIFWQQLYSNLSCCFPSWGSLSSEITAYLPLLSHKDLHPASLLT